MRRYFALLVVVFVGLAASPARAQDAGVDAGTADAAPATPDAAASRPDAAVEYPPAFADDDGCDCAAGGHAPGAGGALLLAAAFLGLRRRR